MSPQETYDHTGFDCEDDMQKFCQEMGLIRTGEGWSWPDHGYNEFMPGTLAGPIKLWSDVSASPPPPPTEFTMAPLYTGLWYDHGSGFDDGGGGGGDDEGKQGFPGGGTNDHQSTLEWTDNSTKTAELSKSLAPAKPIIIENHSQSAQSSTPAPSSSRSGYNRAENKEGKTQCLDRICEALRIPRGEEDYLILRKIIESMGGSAPEHGKPSGRLTKPQRQRWQREDRRRCFEALKGVVCPWMGPVRELKILKNVLKMVTAKSEADEPQGSAHLIVFRA
ncbi:hypothetical protein BJ322DRAFT_1041443 [Thelephora terrestris]|uniref:Uncharacterized protein n=1 Tax=Thelephora terrestris TaxID=56493 RepID=A0A9P6HLX8_9AGAM|nr:hypothetical protein BJ322DRAFT_1041443 [Thelephora terrestris]